MVGLPAAMAQREVSPAAGVAVVAMLAGHRVTAALEQEDKFGWYHGKQLGNDPR